MEKIKLDNYIYEKVMIQFLWFSDSDHNNLSKALKTSTMTTLKTPNELVKF